MKSNFKKIKSGKENVLKTFFNFGLFLFTEPGLELIKKHLFRAFKKLGAHDNRHTNYNKWILEQEKTFFTEFSHDERLDKFPQFNIFLTFKTNSINYFEKSFLSIANQSYQNWELLIIVSKDNADNVEKIISRYDAPGNRVKFLVHSDTSGITPTLNDALSKVNGDFAVLVNDTFVLPPYTLSHIATHINEHNELDIIYTDEDELTENNRYSNPHFKPDYSPDALLSGNYIGDFIIFKTDFIKQLGGFNPEFEGGLFYDLLLRSVEVTDKISHISVVLNHRQCCEVSTYNLEWIQKKNKRAITDALFRRDTPGEVTEIVSTSLFFSVNYFLPKTEKVSIIIPSKDGTDLLKMTIDSLMQNTEYTNYEIIVLNNNSTEKRFFSLMDEYKRKLNNNFVCIEANFPFNFSKLINLGVEQSTGSYILMLNNDIEIKSKSWLTQMVAHATHKKTGAVGVKLLFPDNIIQHAGITLNPTDTTYHVFRNSNKNACGYENRLITINNYSAVTGACLMCRKELYLKVGGMDENLPVEYNDVDLCLKFYQHGYFNVYLPDPVLIHHESATRAHPFRSKKAWEQHNRDLNVFQQKWQKYIDKDPFFNANIELFCGEVA